MPVWHTPLVGDLAHGEKRWGGSLVAKQQGGPSSMNDAYGRAWKRAWTALQSSKWYTELIINTNSHENHELEVPDTGSENNV